MSQEYQIKGIDTITEFSGEPPKKINIPFKLEYKQQSLQQGWNACYIAIIPYCFKCKVPLVWHRNPEHKVLFHCPDCSREWVQGEDWQK